MPCIVNKLIRSSQYYQYEYELLENLSRLVRLAEHKIYPHTGKLHPVAARHMRQLRPGLAQHLGENKLATARRERERERVRHLFT